MDGQIAPKAMANRQESWWLPATWIAAQIRRAFALSVAVMLVIGAGACSSSAPAASSLNPLPAHLLGLSKSTNPDAQALASAFAQTQTPREGAFVHSGQAALYGGSGAGFQIYAASLTSTGASAAASAGYAVSAKAIVAGSGSKDLQSFPAGPHGGALYCSHTTTLSGGTVIDCGWVDQTAVGTVAYNRGSAASLGDAASKTNKIRATIEP